MHRVFEAPQARTGLVHLNVAAVGIGDFVDAIPRLEGPDLNIAKRHGSTPLQEVWTGTDHDTRDRRAIEQIPHRQKTDHYGIFDGPFRDEIV